MGWLDDLTEHPTEFLNPLDPDYGFDISTVPVIGNSFDKLCAKNEECTAVNKVKDNELLVNGVGVVGGGLLGYKLGENFGTFGKLAGGVIGAWVGCKLSKEVATDVAAAADYTKNNTTDDKTSKKNMLQATISNFSNLGSQTYTGQTIDETDITN